MPERYRRGLELYARDHVAPGSFLLLVLEDGKLHEAVARFDGWDLSELRAVLGFVHNELMPGTCHGTPLRVEEWLMYANCTPETPCIHHESLRGYWYESQPAEGSRA